jgi:acetyl esterase/lipase
MSNNSEKTYVYKIVGDRKLELILLQPTVKVYEKAPVMLGIHGGGWRGSSKEEMISSAQPAVDFVRKNGIAVASIGYRLSNEPGVFMADIITDCMDGARYLSKNAEEFKINPQVFVTCGHSAGGQLSLMLAFAPPSAFVGATDLCGYEFKVIGCVNMNGPVVMHPNTEKIRAWGNKRIITSDTYAKLIGCSYDENQEAYIKVSPYYYLNKNSPPFLCIISSNDEVISNRQSFLLCEKAREIGAIFEVVIVENANHGYFHVGEEAMSLSEEQRHELTADFVMRMIAKNMKV